MKRLFFPLILVAAVALAACAKVHVPSFNSMNDVDAAAVNNGEKALVVMRASAPWGSPAETRWLHMETGELYKVTSQFAASRQEDAREFDIVTLPPGKYVLMYVMYSTGSKGVWPGGPFDLDPTKSDVTKLGQVNITTPDKDASPQTVISALRSTGLEKDGKTPLIASFSVTPGEVAFLGNMTVEFSIKGKQVLPGYYPAGSVAWSVNHADLERARLILAKEDPALARKLENKQPTRGGLARRL